MKTLANKTDNSFNEIVLNDTATVTANLSGDIWTLTLPTNDGTAGQSLTTDGLGTTSWTSDGGGTVTSVAATVPAFLNISGSPITSSGTLAIGLSSTALPVLNGGTGVTASTGGGTNNVLANNPTMTGGITIGGIASHDDQIKIIKAANGDRILLGSAESTNRSCLLRWTGTTNDPTNFLEIGFHGGPTSNKFFAGGNVDLDGTLTVAGTTNNIHTFTGLNQALQINNDEGGDENSTQIVTVSSANFFCQGSNPGDTVIRNAVGDKNMLFVAGNSAVGPQLYIQASPLRIGINNSSPTTDLDVTGEISADTLSFRGTTNSTTIQAAAATTAWTLTLPPNDGTAGQVLTTDGAGICTWETP